MEKLTEFHFHLEVAVSSALMVYPAIGNRFSDVVHDTEVLLKIQMGSSFRTLGDGHGQTPVTVLGDCSLARWNYQHLLALCWPSLATV